MSSLRIAYCLSVFRIPCLVGHLTLQASSCPVIYSLEVCSSCANRHNFFFDMPPWDLRGCPKFHYSAYRAFRDWSCSSSSTSAFVSRDISWWDSLKSVLPSASGDVKSANTWWRPWNKSCLWGYKVCSIIVYQLPVYPFARQAVRWGPFITQESEDSYIKPDRKDPFLESQ